MINKFKTVIPNSMHADFQKWRKENNSGYFITQKSEKNFVLHFAHCWHQGSPDYPGPHDMAKSLKVCSDSKGELLSWATEKMCTVVECQHCLKKRPNENAGISIREIVESINSRAEDYRIGDLQAIRKDIKKLKRQPGKYIFSEVTTSDDGWAFHYGGRKEIQFNVGFEKEGIRYGLAFSLEPSQTLSKIDDLFPKIQKLNSLIRDKPELFRNCSYWYWHPDLGRSLIMPVAQISPSVSKKDYFIFIGRLVKEVDFDPDLILSHFDQMLPIYLEVESLQDVGDDVLLSISDEFSFKSESRSLIESRVYSTEEKMIDVDIRHSLIQKALYSLLVKEYGNDNVSLENPIMGNRIDAVVRTLDGYIFYEIKVATSAKSCIRQALGQLMEYAYFPGKVNAVKIVVVGEPELNSSERIYVRFLQDEFNLPIEYLSVSLINEV